MYPQNGKGTTGLAGGANGEGNLMYPGVHGPVASNRLINVADGIEGDHNNHTHFLCPGLSF